MRQYCLVKLDASSNVVFSSFCQAHSRACNLPINHKHIHRDVKPENILLDADNRLLLSDSGYRAYIVS